MTRRRLLLGFGAAAASAFAQNARRDHAVWLGDSQVHLIVMDVRRSAAAPFVFFHPHENEHASAVVARQNVRSLGGRLVEVRSRGERLIPFKIAGRSYTVDPNRLFTEAGAIKSLQNYAFDNSAALAAVRNLRETILHLLDSGRRPIVAVHNNARDGMNAAQFQSGGRLASAASAVWLNPRENPHSFFLVTDSALGAKLYHAGFNTVVQSPDGPDDGSLSVYCQSNGWQYVNVETAEADFRQQQRMIDALVRLYEPPEESGKVRVSPDRAAQAH